MFLKTLNLLVKLINNKYGLTTGKNTLYMLYGKKKKKYKRS